MLQGDLTQHKRARCACNQSVSLPSTSTENAYAPAPVGFVAATEARIESRMEGRGQAVGDAVKDLFNSSGPNAKGRARSDNPADTTSPAGKAYESMVLAFADLQRAYGIAFVEAGQSVSTKVSGLGQAAAQVCCWNVENNCMFISCTCNCSSPTDRCRMA